MSGKCVKCKEDLLSTDIVAKCVDCKTSLHAKCTRAGSSQNVTKAKFKTYKCDECKDESSSANSVRSMNEESEERKFFMEVLDKLKKDINKNTDDKIEQVLLSVKEISEDINKLQSSVTALEAAQHDIEKRCDKMEHADAEQCKEIHRLRQQLHDSEQHQRAANIEIIGLPLTDKEDIYACLEQIAKAIAVPFKRDDFSIAHRLRLYSTRRHLHPPIIAQFISRNTRTCWIAAAKMKRNLNSTDVNPSLQPSKMFINEHLTAHNKQLLGRARRLQKEKKLHFATYSNGRVLVKTSATTDSIHIIEIEDLDIYDREK